MVQPKDWDVQKLLDTYIAKGQDIYKKTPKGLKKVSCCINSNGYMQCTCFNKSMIVHRLLWILHHKRNPGILDHINGDRTDNRIENLREVTYLGNAQNKEMHRKGKLVGAVYYKKLNYFLPQIQIKGKKYTLGAHNTQKEAHKVYKYAEKYPEEIVNKSNKQLKAFLRLKGLLKVSTKIKGYSLEKTTGKYRVRGKIKNKLLDFGSFVSQEEARKQYEKVCELRDKMLVENEEYTIEEFTFEWKRRQNEN